MNRIFLKHKRIRTDIYDFYDFYVDLDENNYLYEIVDSTECIANDDRFHYKPYDSTSDHSKSSKSSKISEDHSEKYFLSFQSEYKKFYETYSKSLKFNEKINTSHSFQVRDILTSKRTHPRLLKEIWEVFRYFQVILEFPKYNIDKNYLVYCPNEIFCHFLENNKNKHFYTNKTELKEFYFIFIFPYLYNELRRKRSKIELTGEEIISLQIEKYYKHIKIIKVSKEVNFTQIIQPSRIILFPQNDRLYKLTRLSGTNINEDLKNKILFNREVFQLLPDNLNRIIRDPAKNIVRNIRRVDINMSPTNSLDYSLSDETKIINKCILGLRTIFINLGPGDIEFYCLKENNIREFDYYFQKLKNNTWFPEIGFFLENQIKVNYTLLGAYQMVIIPVEYISFYRARQRTFTYTYEWGLIDESQFNLLSMNNISLISKKHKPQIKTLTILLDVVNKNMSRLSKNFLSYAYITLSNIINQEEQNIEKFFHCKKILEPQEINPKICSDCLSELFNYSTYCKFCDPGIEISFKCLKCIEDICCPYRIIYFKYRKESLFTLLERISSKITNSINSLNSLKEESEDLNQSSYQNELTEDYKYWNSLANNMSVSTKLIDHNDLEIFRNFLRNFPKNNNDCDFLDESIEAYYKCERKEKQSNYVEDEIDNSLSIYLAQY